MTFNPLKEKGIPLDKQLRNWEKIAGYPYKRESVDCYTRTRQILMNGIEIEGWNFKHNLLRMTTDSEIKKLVADTRHIEYVKETYDFGLLEDFDHLYRYSQFAYMVEGTNPNEILHNKTDVMFARPTQYHHNDNKIRMRKGYDKNTASPQTKANILTLLAGEQQTHNFYAEHGFMYGSDDLRRLYAEICDVEEEHVTMYETLIDPTETPLEKLLLREFMEVCCYQNCYNDEIDPKIKLIWEEFLAMEIEHLQIAGKLLQKFEKRDPEEIIGTEVFDTCHFEVQKKYVNSIIESEVDKRLDGREDMGYCKIDELDDNWPSYKVQEIVSGEGAPSETSVRVSAAALNSDVYSADNSIIKDREKLIQRALELKVQAPNTVSVDEYSSFEKNKCFIKK